MTTFRVPVGRCRFTLQALDLGHVFPLPDQPVEQGPIVVSRLNDGSWFVHNGRHRVLRAQLGGIPELEAITLEDHHATIGPPLPLQGHDES